ncbi:MAG: ribonuclease [Oscillospiraceae bacterium]|nr:ribonuclease [Oscillospiraceae bacterium]
MLMRKCLALLLAALLLLSLAACGTTPAPVAEDIPIADLPLVDTAEDAATEAPIEDTPQLDENGVYDSRDDVALYLHLYGALPRNYITKRQARDLGWSGGSVEVYAPGCCIGGDRFGNYEGLLPEAPGRTYYECDIDTLGASSRGAKRIIYSNDGLIYYTEDHYASFTLLYGEVSP